jgi:hypothetical protein
VKVNDLIARCQDTVHAGQNCPSKSPQEISISFVSEHFMSTDFLDKWSEVLNVALEYSRQSKRQNVVP